MNPYYYWFFAIYHIYAKFNGRDFPFFASGMFSILGSLLIMNITLPPTLIFTQNKLGFLFLGKVYFISIFIITIFLFILNDWLFLRQKRDKQLYNEVYLKIRKRWKDTIAILFSISIFSLFIFNTLLSN